MFLLASFIRVHNAVPGLSGPRRNTRGFHSVNQGLVPNSASTSSPVPVLRLSPSPHEHLRCSLSSFVRLCVLFASSRHSLCLFRLPHQALLAIAASSPAPTPFSALASHDYRAFLLCPRSAHQHHGPAVAQRLSHRIPRQPALHIAGLVYLQLTFGLLTCLYPPIC